MEVARASALKKGVRLVFCHDGGQAEQIKQWLCDPDMDCLPQTSGDLGDRMLAAFQHAFDQGANQVVLVGTDIPGITIDFLFQAFNALNSNDLVLGPSTDGGYWLVGMKKAQDIFSNIAWSRSDVLEKTLDRAGQKEMSPFLLKKLTDLDTAEDLNRETDWKCAYRPYLSVIIPALNEEGRIAETLESARSPDAELIVSDGGSTDRTVTISHVSGARIVYGKIGRAAQQNRGAAIAMGEVLLFLHADTKLPQSYVTHIFEAFMDQKNILGAFRFDTDLNTPSMNRIVYWTNLRADKLKLPYGDQGLFIRKKDFHAAGGFPEVPIAEDLYIVRKMARHGRIVIAPAAVVTSGRRWEKLGPLRTTLVNAIIAAGCLAGISPGRLAPLYRWSKKRTLS